MSSLSLPREVTDCIIDIVANDISNRQTLCAIAQVSRLFVDRAHHHLFFNLHLNLPFRSSLDGSAEMLQGFTQVLRDGLQFPAIGILNHIRHFHVKDLLGSTKHATGIFRLLCDINRLESLTLRLHVSFLSLGEECRASLIDLCHSPILNALTIYGLFDIPHCLLHGSHIKQVNLSYFKFLSYPSDQPKMLYQPESITTLSSQFGLVLDAFHVGGGNIESSTRYREAFACLKELNITVCTILEIPLFLDAASLARGPLKQVKLQMSFSQLSPKSTPTCPFHSLSNLSILQLDFHQVYPPPVNWVFSIGQLLQSCSLPPSLEKLRLSLISFPVVIGGDGVPTYELEKVDWDSLDRILINSPFCAIPSITLTFHQPFEFRPNQAIDRNLKDDVLAKWGGDFIPEDKMPLFTASRPGNFVVDVQTN